MILLSPEHLEALRDRYTWLDNPFLRREAARDARRKYPAKSFAWLLLLMTLFGGGAVWLLLILRERHFGIPWFVGGTFGTAVAAVVCGAHSWFVAGAARKHTAFMIAQEANRNTLQSLLMLPTPPFQMLLQAAVYPWLAGMQLALAGLPFYVLCVAAGGLTWLDLLMLYLLFGIMAVALPSWSFPALSGRTSFIAPTQPGQQAPTATTATTDQTAAAANASTSGGGAAAGFWLPLIFMAVMMPLLVRGGGIGGAYAALNRYIPSSVLDLLPTAFIGWPLVAARALVAPFDWFGIPLPPLPFILASFLAGRYLQAVRSSEYLRVGTYRDLLDRPTYLPRRRAEGALRFTQMLVLTGYLWRWAVGDGGLGIFVPPAARGAASGLAGLVYLVLFMAALRTNARAKAVAIWQRGTVKPEQAEKLPYTLRLSGKSMRQFVTMPYVSAVGFYLACCLLSRTWPFPVAVCALGGKVLAVGIAGSALQYSLRRGVPALSGLGALLPLLIVFGDPAFGPLAVFSPLLGLLHLANPSLILQSMMGVAPPPGLLAFLQSQTPWWSWLLAGGAVTILALLWRKPLPSGDSTPEPTEPTAAPKIIIDPTLVGAEVYMDHLLERSEKAAREETLAGARVIEVAQRLTDNAVTMKELRARMRGKLSPKMLQTSGVIFTVVTLLLLTVPAISVRFGGGLAQALFGMPPTPAAQVASSALACWYLVLLWMSLSVGTGILPYIFAPEREKSTLGFLLLTPMRAGAIIAGKLGGMLLSNTNGPAMLAAGTLLLTIVASPAVGLANGLLVWGKVVLTALAILLAGAGGSAALAALFPRRISQMGCAAILNMIFLQVPIQLSINLGRVAGRRRGSPFTLPIDGHLLWMIFLAVCAVVFAIGVLLAIWGVKRMRKGDIAFEASRQEN